MDTGNIVEYRNMLHKFFLALIAIYGPPLTVVPIGCCYMSDSRKNNEFSCIRLFQTFSLETVTSFYRDILNGSSMPIRRLQLLNRRMESGKSSVKLPIRSTKELMKMSSKEPDSTAIVWENI